MVEQGTRQIHIKQFSPLERELVKAQAKKEGKTKPQFYRDVIVGYCQQQQSHLGGDIA